MNKLSIPLALFSILLLAACAQTMIKKTYVSEAPVTEPRSIYIRPFSMAKTDFRGDFGMTDAERELRKGQAAVKFARILQEEVAKIAPAMVIAEDEVAPEGWLIDGEMDVVDAGDRVGRAILGPLGAGRSTIAMHVRVTDVKTGKVIYAFDVSGGSGLTGAKGSTGSAGVGLAESFDYRNAAQTIFRALSMDDRREGYRSAR